MDFKEFIKRLVENKETLKKDLGLDNFDIKTVENWIHDMEEKVAGKIYEECVKGNEGDYIKMSEKLYQLLENLGENGRTIFAKKGKEGDFRDEKLGSLDKTLRELGWCDPITVYSIIIHDYEKLSFFSVDINKDIANSVGFPQIGVGYVIFPSQEDDFKKSWELFIKVYEFKNYLKDKDKIWSNDFREILNKVIGVKGMGPVKLSQILYLMKPSIFTALQNDGLNNMKKEKIILGSEIETYFQILHALHQDAINLTNFPTVWFSNFIFFKIRKEEELKSILQKITQDSRGTNINQSEREDKITKNIFNQMETLLNFKKQIILYGPPGTGKTYLAKKFVEKQAPKENDSKFITFHPSYSYEDFIEGIKPKIDENTKQIKFEVEDGIFKKLCKEAFNKLMEHTGITNKWIEELPILNEDEKRAVKDKLNNAPKYYLIIDEINRGDISKIFGELITLLESDKRLFSENEVIVELPYSKTKFGVPPNLYIIGTMNTADRSIALIDIALRRRFGFIEIMPSYAVLLNNLLSEYKDIEKENEAIAKIENWQVEELIDIRKLAIKVLFELNRQIESYYDRDHRIGHSYLLKLKGLENEEAIRQLQYVWYHEILPLFQEYFYDSPDKLKRVLNKAFIEESNNEIEFKIIESNEEFLEELKNFLEDLKKN